MPQSWGFCETDGPLDPETVKGAMTRLGNYGREFALAYDLLKADGELLELGRIYP